MAGNGFFEQQVLPIQATQSFLWRVWEESFSLPSRWKLTTSSQREDAYVHATTCICSLIMWTIGMCLSAPTNKYLRAPAGIVGFFLLVEIQFTCSFHCMSRTGAIPGHVGERCSPSRNTRYPYLLVLTGVRRRGAGESWKTRGFSKSHAHLTFRIACLNTSKENQTWREMLCFLLLPRGANKNQPGKVAYIYYR